LARALVGSGTCFVSGFVVGCVGSAAHFGTMARQTLAPCLLVMLFLALFCSMLQRSDAAPRKKKDGDEKTVPMPLHSFSPPLSYENLLNDWRLSGASLMEKERALIHPNVAERHGFLWSKWPVLTESFEIIVNFRVAGAKEPLQTVKDQSFAFWYVKENVSDSFDESILIKAANWTDGLRQAKYTFSGFKDKFEGIGAVLSMADSEGKPKPAVTYVESDGKKELVYGKDAPLATSKGLDFRNTLNAAQMKIRITPLAFEVHMKQSPSLSWNPLINVDRTANPIASGGYFGFTAYSGSATPGVVSDMLSITEVSADNLDTTQIGEEMKDVSREIQEAYRDMLTHENRHFIDQKSQKEHIDRLTKMLQQHIESAKPAEEKMWMDLETLNSRVGRLDDNCKTLHKELTLVTGSPGKLSATAIKKDIVGLRRVFTKEAATHRQKIETVHRNVVEVKKVKETGNIGQKSIKEIVEQNEKLEQTIAAKSSQGSWMMFIVIALIIGIGVLMYNKMNHYEKKHFF